MRRPRALARSGTVVNVALGDKRIRARSATDSHIALRHSTELLQARIDLPSSLAATLPASWPLSPL